MFSRTFDNSESNVSKLRPLRGNLSKGGHREHLKTISLMSKNNGLASTLYVLVHFFAVISKTAQ